MELLYAKKFSKDVDKIQNPLTLNLSPFTFEQVRSALSAYNDWTLAKG